MIDANLLVLWAVGSANVNYILKHKRLRIYQERDFTTLKAILSEAAEVILTPNTLTEASNLAAYIENPAKTEIFHSLKIIINNCQEIYVESRKATLEYIYPRLGLTDAALMAVSRSNTIILTVDFDLYIEASKAGFEVINFTHYLAANV